MVAVVAASLAGPAPALAHGIWGHVHVTGWAIENLPPGELRDFFDEPAVFNAALYGAAFTDSGYWPQGGELSQRSRAYSEHTHWEPFVEDFVAWVLVNDPPPWTDLASRQRAAFLMGCGAHGLQDEIFDSLFLYQIEEHDAGSQDEADPGTDGFLALDGHIRFVPEPWIPLETLLELYEVLDEDIDEDVIEQSMGLMNFVYLNEAGIEIARNLGEEHREVIPWSRDHYLDPDVPGSLVAEITPTAGYLQAIWDRLHGRDFDLVVHTYPNPPRRLHGLDAGSPDSWVTLVSGKGIKGETAATSWTVDSGDAQPFALAGTRWGGLATWGRLLRLLPEADVPPGSWSTVALAPGIGLVDGTAAEAGFEVTFQAPCDGSDPAACPELELCVPPTDGVSPPCPAAEAPADASEGGPDADVGPEPDGVDEADPDPEPEPVGDGSSGCGGAPGAPPLWLGLLGVLGATRPRTPRPRGRRRRCPARPPRGRGSAG